MFAFSIFNPFKFLYVTFDFWVKGIQKGALFFPKYFFPPTMNTIMNHIHLYLYKCIGTCLTFKLSANK